MILLEPNNRIVYETLLGIFTNANVEVTDITVYDFDDIHYNMKIQEGNLTQLQLSFNQQSYHEFEAFAAKTLDDFIEKQVGSLGKVVKADESTFSFTLNVDLSALPESVEDKEKFANVLSMLRRYVMGGLFEYYFEALESKQEGVKCATYHLRGDTTCYVIPKADRVVLIYEVDFANHVDKCIAKVFMQEFADSKNVRNAPPVKWSETPPAEMTEFDITESSGSLGYLSFAVLPSHVKATVRPNVVAVLQNFRSYLSYHIKCSKSYFHSRMRARIKSLKQVLNRAKLVVEEDTKKKKTASGKTWKQ